MPISYTTYEGKSEAEALEKACNELKLDKSRVRYSVLEKKKKIFGEKVMISVETKKPLEDFFDEIYDITKLFFDNYFEYLGIEGKVIYPILKNNYAFISIETSKDYIFTNDHAAVLKSAQTILNAVGRGIAKYDIRVVLDCNDYRLKRNNFLREVAIEKAQEVKKTKRVFVFKPLEPFERKIIHIALQEDHDIFTESEGDSKIKRLKIIPKRRK